LQGLCLGLKGGTIGRELALHVGDQPLHTGLDGLASHRLGQQTIVVEHTDAGQGRARIGRGLSLGYGSAGSQ